MANGDKHRFAQVSAGHSHVTAASEWRPETPVHRQAAALLLTDCDLRLGHGARAGQGPDRRCNSTVCNCYGWLAKLRTGRQRPQEGGCGRMKSRRAIFILAGAAGVVAAGLAPAAAQSSATWTVHPGGHITITLGVLTLEGTRNGTETFA